VKVPILRSEPGASAMARALSQAGYRTSVRPLLKIVPLPESPETLETVCNLHRYDDIISVSAHASRLLCQRLGYHRISPVAGSRWLAVGPGSASALAPLAAEVVVPARGNGSQALLDTMALQSVAKRRILICRGRGGLGILTDTLSRHGASVDQLVLYERIVDTEVQTSIGCIPIQDIDALVVSSGRILEALCMSRPANQWRATVLAPSSRVARLACRAGFHQVHNCDGASAGHILTALAHLGKPGK